jgi:hypothetical protein
MYAGYDLCHFSALAVSKATYFEESVFLIHYSLNMFRQVPCLTELLLTLGALEWLLTSMRSCV